VSDYPEMDNNVVKFPFCPPNLCDCCGDDPRPYYIRDLCRECSTELKRYATTAELWPDV
jgi:hypothetical protein